MSENKLSKFLKKQKPSLESYREEKDIEFLDSKYRQFLEILKKINSHRSYEAEFETEKINGNFIDAYNTKNYLPEINKKILLPLSKRETLCMKFFQLFMCFDFSEFKFLTEEIYNEILFRMIELAAENDFCEVKEFVRKIYEYKCDEAQSLKVQDFITKMLQTVKTPEKSAQGIAIINALLFQHGIIYSEDLRKMFSKTSVLHFICWMIFPFALAVVVCTGFFNGGILREPVTLLAEFVSKRIYDVKDYSFETSFIKIFILSLMFLFVLFAESNFIIFLFRKKRIRYLKQTISKIASIFEIAEDFIYKKLSSRYGGKIKKLLQ